MFERIKLYRDNFIENLMSGDKTARRWLIIICGIILFLAIGIIGIIHLNKGYTGYTVLNETDKNDDVSVSYQVLGNGLVRYSKDGASYTDKDGKTVWNQSFALSNAQVDVCDDYMVIGDIGSNQIRTFNHNGQVTVIDAIYPVASVEVASQGVVAAILTDGTQHYINLYDAEGQELARIRATLVNTGYPVDLALSEDGTKLAVSYLVVSDGDVKTQLIFYKFSDAQARSGNNVVGTYDYEQIFPKVDFINNNTLVAFGESGFEIFSMKNDTPESVLSNGFDADIKSIFYNEQYIGFVFRNEGNGSTNDEARQVDEGVAVVSANSFSMLGSSVDDDGIAQGEVPVGTPHESQVDMETTGNVPSLNTGETEQVKNDTDQYRYRMLVYTNSGIQYLDKEFNFDYTYVECTNDEIIMYNDTECLMMNYKGQTMFEYTFEKNIHRLMPKKAQNQYILIDDDTIQEIKLR